MQFPLRCLISVSRWWTSSGGYILKYIFICKYNELDYKFYNFLLQQALISIKIYAKADKIP